jgi:hypothetical protein
LNNYCESLHCSQHSPAADITNSSGNDLITKGNYLQAIDSFGDYFQNQGTVGSQYDVQLAHWLRYVRRDQIFIMSMSDLVTNTSSMMRQLSVFLNLTNAEFAIADDVKVGPRKGRIAASLGNVSAVKGEIQLPEKNINTLKDTNMLPPCDCTTFDKFKSAFDLLGTGSLIYS